MCRPAQRTCVRAHTRCTHTVHTHSEFTPRSPSARLPRENPGHGAVEMERSPRPAPEAGARGRVPACRAVARAPSRRRSSCQTHTRWGCSPVSVSSCKDPSPFLGSPPSEPHHLLRPSLRVKASTCEVGGPGHKHSAHKTIIFTKISEQRALLGSFLHPKEAPGPPSGRASARNPGLLPRREGAQQTV